MKKTFEITTSADVDLNQDTLLELITSVDLKLDEEAGIIVIEEIPNTVEPDQTKEVHFSVPEDLVRETYIALCDAHHRLDKGNMLLYECITRFSKDYSLPLPEHLNG